MRKRIQTKKDLEAIDELIQKILFLLPSVRELGDDAARVAKSLPINVRGVSQPVEISHKSEAIILRSMIIFRQNTELAACLEGILNDEQCLAGDYAGWRSFIQSTLSDILWQAKMICRVMGLDLKETLQLGGERNRMKAEEFRTEKHSHEWY